MRVLTWIVVMVLTIQLVGQNRTIVKEELEEFEIKYDKVFFKNESAFFCKKMNLVLGDKKMRYKHYFKLEIILNVDSTLNSRIDIFYKEKCVEYRHVNGLIVNQLYRDGRESFYAFWVFDQEQKKEL